MGASRSPTVGNCEGGAGREKGKGREQALHTIWWGEVAEVAEVRQMGLGFPSVLAERFSVFCKGFLGLGV